MRNEAMYDVRQWQAHKELATAQRIFDDHLPEFPGLERHAGESSCGLRTRQD
jgi:hypothetical protein